MMAGDFVMAAVLLPLVGAVFIATSGARPNLREGYTIFFGVLLIIVVYSLAPDVLAGARPATQAFEVMPDVSIRLEVEPLGMLFAMVASGLWIINSLYSIGYMRGNTEPRQTQFYAAFAVAIASTMGIAFAGNLFTLFLFYEVLTLSTYPLVTHKGTNEARAGGRVYLGILLFTSVVFLLPAIIATYFFTGTLEFQPGGVFDPLMSTTMFGVISVLFIYGVGKAAVMPVHRWLPAAMVAPTPVSALLHAVAVVKAGVFYRCKNHRLCLWHGSFRNNGGYGLGGVRRGVHRDRLLGHRPRPR